MFYRSDLPEHVWERDRLEAYLNENGIGTTIHYPTAIHRQKAYENLGLLEGSYPLAEEIAATELSIPMYYGMTEEQIRYVIDTLNRWR